MSQQGPLQRCTHCGANLGVDDLRGTNCRYCGTALAHHARAAEHAALVNQVLNQQLQARGLAPPANPIVPYHYGAPPNLPYPTPGVAPNMIGPSVEQAARRGITAAILISVAVGLVVLLAVAGVVAWVLVAR
jgi:hypothetical protein